MEELAARERRALGERFQLGPRDLRMRASAKAAVAARDNVLAADAFRIARDALGDDLRMLHYVGRVGDDTRHQDLSVRQLDALPHRVLVLMPRVRALDEIRLRLYAQHEIDDVLELDVVGMRPVPAAPAEVIAHAIFGDVAQRMIQSL